MKEKKKELEILESQHADASLDMKPKDILRNIFYYSSHQTGEGPVTESSRTLAYSSSLLAVLSAQAEKSTKKMIRLTYALFGLTVALLVVAIVQIIIFKQDANTNAKTIQTQTNCKQQQTENKPIQPIQTEKPKYPVRNENHK